jgi:hypothetical protein
MNQHPGIVPSWSAPVLVFLAGIFLSACGSVTKVSKLEVKAGHNALAPQRDNKTYSITCESALVQRWFVSNPKALVAFGASLEKLGYEEAMDPKAATYNIKVEMGFGPRAESPVRPEENPDSIRYQNVAALAGQGRYSQILTERNESGGSLLVGPNGEIVPTGGWKRVVEDSERATATSEPLAYDSLILRAWDVGDRKPGAEIFVWEILIQRPVDHRMPSPEHVGLLLGEAAARLEAGWAGTPTATGASVVRTK